VIECGVRVNSPPSPTIHYTSIPNRLWALLPSNHYLLSAHARVHVREGGVCAKGCAHGERLCAGSTQMRVIECEIVCARSVRVLVVCVFMHTNTIRSLLHLGGVRELFWLCCLCAYRTHTNTQKKVVWAPLWAYICVCFVYKHEHTERLVSGAQKHTNITNIL
jgi:hypothetical protein